ncbi:hypothetical protein M404DRAFT_848743 [Pisolithus tinctorius Marx 270]|uniref:Uncharacterized protein n=1 Tax=Pisolithus tinctorius Marx 270 TaxID=870435 RepID=A0A0C3JLW1_PISTI|nr:hypothetical protein M404DRAFT_848743 [Pisolithus tinctorius Marx 270]
MPSSALNTSIVNSNETVSPRNTLLGTNCICEESPRRRRTGIQEVLRRPLHQLCATYHGFVWQATRYVKLHRHMHAPVWDQNRYYPRQVSCYWSYTTIGE